MTDELVVTLQLRRGSKIIATESVSAGSIAGRKLKEIAAIAEAEAAGMVEPLIKQVEKVEGRKPWQW